MKLLKDIKNLVLGMGITGKHLGRHAITIQYPEEKWTMPERSRGIVVLLSDKETGELNCTACMLCMRSCPTGAIVIDAPRDENKKRQLKKFEVNHGICCFCGMCEEACNFCAIKMATKYEFSTENKADLTWDIHKLQEVGRDVDYVDTRKKKTAAEEKPAPKSEATPKAEPPATEKPNTQSPEKEAESENKTQPPTGNEGNQENKE